MKLEDAVTARPRLEVRCSRCQRRGLYRTATLIERFGRGVTLLELADRLSGNCRLRDEPPAKRCDLYYPGVDAELTSSDLSIYKSKPERGGGSVWDQPNPARSVRKYWR